MPCAETGFGGTVCDHFPMSRGTTAPAAGAARTRPVASRTSSAATPAGPGDGETRTARRRTRRPGPPAPVPTDAPTVNVGHEPGERLGDRARAARAGPPRRTRRRARAPGRPRRAPPAPSWRPRPASASAAGSRPPAAPPAPAAAARARPAHCRAPYDRRRRPARRAPSAAISQPYTDVAAVVVRVRRRRPP